MKLIYCINIFAFLFFPLCASRYAIERDIIPAETVETKIIDEKCALVISRNFGLAVEEIKEDHLKDILKNDTLISKGLKFKSLRMPKLIFFKIVIENTGDIPIDIGEIRLQYDNTISRALTAEYLKNKYSPPAYPALDFAEILSLFKLNAEELCENNIDFNKDIIKYAGHAIRTGDRALQIAVFDWIPVQIRKFTLSIAIKSDISQKIIDFKLMKFEYRQSGKYFVKPEKDDNDD